MSERLTKTVSIQRHAIQSYILADVLINSFLVIWSNPIILDAWLCKTAQNTFCCHLETLIYINIDLCQETSFSEWRWMSQNTCDINTCTPANTTT